jgi:hypothetical protein
MSDTPSERVEQARDALGQLAWDSDCRADLNPVMDELVAAVRAERDAEIRGQIEALRNGEVTFAAVLSLLTDKEGEA